MKSLSIITFCILFSFAIKANAQGKKQPAGKSAYNSLSVYVVAHQDDWQLFMGANVFSDINDYDEKNPSANGKKVVIIYTTAGDLNDVNDSLTCACRDLNDPQPPQRVPYWRTREEGTKNSIHLAASRIGGYGPNGGYPQCTTVNINGHNIARYDYKNTTSYYLRLKAGEYTLWYYNDATIDAIDQSTTYMDWDDFVSTLYYIYKAEMNNNSIGSDNIAFNFPEINESINPNDHTDHLIAGKAGWEAAKLLGNDYNTCFPESLYIGYYSKDLPPNIQEPDVQNEAAVTAVYCLALLDYNAWPEWGSSYQDWTNRNYFRTISTCDLPRPAGNSTTDNTTLHATIKPIPADESLSVDFNLPSEAPINIKLIDMKGAVVYNATTRLTTQNTLQANTTNLPDGTYLAVITAGSNMVSKTKFDIVHHH